MKEKRQEKLQPILVGILVFLLMMGFFTLVISSVRSSMHQQDQVRLMERFVEFQSDVESLFNRNIILLKGYTSFLMMTGEIDERESDIYLKNLIGVDPDIIRNVAILQDTTVRFVYPTEGNSAVLGRDLAQVPTQRDSVLLAKNSLQNTLQGPVDLVQGGTGFIARVPFTVDGAYWGQVSLVLDGASFFRKIDDFAAAADMQISLFHEGSFPDTPFHGDIGILTRDPIILDMNISTAKWKVAFLPASGWKSAMDVTILAGFGSFILSLIPGILMFQILRANALIRKESVTDHLTGLYNRNFLEEYDKLLMERASRSNTGVAALMIDLDHFKAINDRYGHRAGDEVLMTVSSRLRSICRGTEAVFRLGGDEFLFMFPDMADRNLMDPIIERIRSSVRQPIPYKGHALQVEPSIGLSMFPEDGKTIDALMQRADEAMYAEKDRHRGEPGTLA